MTGEARQWTGMKRIVQEWVESVNKSKEKQEKKQKDKRKHRCEGRQMTSEAALKCTLPVCAFADLSKAGLTNHTRQIHQQPLFAQCSQCHRSFHCQGLLNHQCFCPERPGNWIHTTTYFSLACNTPLFHCTTGETVVNWNNSKPWIGLFQGTKCDNVLKCDLDFAWGKSVLVAVTPCSPFHILIFLLLPTEFLPASSTWHRAPTGPSHTWGHAEVSEPLRNERW